MSIAIEDVIMPPVATVTDPPAPPAESPETSPQPAPDSPAESDPPAAADSATMHVIKGGGDDLTWNPNDPAEVEVARERFTALVKAGNLAYKADTAHSAQFGGEQIREFDPRARMIVVVAPLQGG